MSRRMLGSRTSRVSSTLTSGGLNDDDDDERGTAKCCV